ncbi:MAG TPA: hypothetical protein VK960_05890 [Acidimicrobiia bacterium]|nr:hypothetical protein [Acidimicrobiia bacterium]
MRIALHSVGEVGRRAGLVLLGERDLIALGLYGHQGRRREDRRTIVIRELDGFDPLVTDDTDAASGLAGIAADDGISCVVTADEIDPEIAARFTDSGLTLLTGANVSGIAESLAAHEVARTDRVTETTAAWTVPGKPLRKGEAVAFPDPVGARWGEAAERTNETTRIEVPIEGEWAGASATVSGAADGEPVQRVVGIADLRMHLEGLALAAGAIVVAEGSIPPGVHRPGDHPEMYLDAALRVGLEVAAYSSG